MRVLAWPLHSPTNPYTTLLYAAMSRSVTIDEFAFSRLAREYAVWHIHWPDALLNIRNPLLASYKLSALFASIDWLHSRKTRIIWTIHNLSSHEALHPALERWFWPHFLPRVDGVISLSKIGLDSALERFSRLKCKPATVIPHGHYRDTYPKVGREVRQQLSIPVNAKIILFFGAIRRYKNVKSLMQAFRKLETENVMLYIVGQPNAPELAQSILGEATLDTRISVRFGFLKPDELAAYLGASDLVVLPYGEILNSGSALLALSCDRPILVPDRGSMGELKDEFSNKWVQTYERDLDETILERALGWACESRPAVCRVPEKFQWENISSETVQFYKSISSS